MPHSTGLSGIQFPMLNVLESYPEGPEKNIITLRQSLIRYKYTQVILTQTLMS